MSGAAAPWDQESLGRLRRRFESEAEGLERAMEDFADPSQEWRRLSHSSGLSCWSSSPLVGG